MIETIGWLGSFFFAICGIPQAWESYKTKNSDGISQGFLWLWILGEVFTLFYISDQDNILLPLITNYLVNLLSLTVITYYKYFSKIPKNNLNWITNDKY